MNIFEVALIRYLVRFIVSPFNITFSNGRNKFRFGRRPTSDAFQMRATILSKATSESEDKNKPTRLSFGLAEALIALMAFT